MSGQRSAKRTAIYISTITYIMQYSTYTYLHTDEDRYMQLCFLPMCTYRYTFVTACNQLTAVQHWLFQPALTWTLLHLCVYKQRRTVLSSIGDLFYRLLAIYIKRRLTIEMIVPSLAGAQPWKKQGKTRPIIIIA